MRLSRSARIAARHRRSTLSGTSWFENAPLRPRQSKWCARHPSGTRCVGYFLLRGTCDFVLMVREGATRRQR